MTGAKVAAGTLTASHFQDGAALTEILDDDGPGSGLNADLLDNYDSSAFSLEGHNHDGAYVNATGDIMSATSSTPVLSVTNTGTGYGVSGSASGTNGRGVHGHASGSSGRGVEGIANNAEATINYGGYFQANGTQGRGIYALASGTQGYGVFGHASNTGDLTSYGGYFLSNGSDGRGVYGDATNTGDVLNYGGYFRASGTEGRGVYGSATNDGNGENYGGYFEAKGMNSRGVYGYASNTGDGINYGGYFRSDGLYGYGVYGVSSGTNGVAVRGHATNTGEDAYNLGGSFRAEGVHSRGVLGKSTGTEGVGVYGEGNSTSGAGVFGEGHIGVQGWSASGWGVFGYAAAITAVTNYGGYFKADGTSGRGVYGAGKAYDFYAGGTGIDYGPFTGGHEVKLSEDFPEDTKPGMIVSVTGQTQVRRLENGTPCLSSTLPTVKLSIKAADKAVFGVLVAETPLPEDHWYEAKEGERFATVNALGEGRAWVSNINGDIEVGDYLTTSSIPGYGQRQDDDLLHSYTLGKAIEAVDWPSVTETVLIEGREIKVYLIAVTYTSG